MIRAIRVEQIRVGANKLEQTELRGIIRLEQSRGKESREKCGRSEQSEKIPEREKSRAKIENKV